MADTQIILKESVPGLGAEADIVKVRKGFARNHLIPTGKAYEVTASSLKRLRTPSPEYPDTALAQRIAGSVTLEFTVDTSGETRDIHVVEATPPGVFDQAAISAVKHWRYAPLLVNGAAVDVPVRTRMRFELPK